KSSQISVMRLSDNNHVIGDYSMDNKCVLNGFSVTYHDNGYIYQVMQYYKGELTGPKYQFNSDGTISSIDYYENGHINGISKYYLPNGRLFRLCDYSQDSLIRCDTVRYQA